MRKMGVFLLAVGAVAVVGVVAGAVLCGGWWPVGTRYEDETSSAAAITAIRVSGGTVAARVRPGPAGSVTVHRTASYLNPFQAAPPETYRIEAGVLELGGDDACSLCKVEYVVTAPEGVSIEADIATGSIDVSSVSSVDATVSTGSVTVAAATGDVTAHVGTGSISGRDLGSSRVVAVAKTGGVSIDVAVPADVEAATSLGAVDVTVPAGAYRVQATQRAGTPDLGIANDPAAPHLLVLRTDMGRIQLATR